MSIYYDRIFGTLTETDRLAIAKVHKPLPVSLPLAPVLERMAEAHPETTGRDMVADMFQTEMTVQVMAPNGDLQRLTGRPAVHRTTRFGRDVYNAYAGARQDDTKAFDLSYIKEA